MRAQEEKRRQAAVERANQVAQTRVWAKQMHQQIFGSPQKKISQRDPNYLHHNVIRCTDCEVRPSFNWQAQFPDSEGAFAGLIGRDELSSTSSRSQSAGGGLHPRLQVAGHSDSSSSSSRSQSAGMGPSPRLHVAGNILMSGNTVYKQRFR